MRKAFLFLSVCCCTILHAQVPVNALSLEDALFDKSFSTRSIPVVKGILRNLPAEEAKTTVVKYTIVTPFSGKQVTKNATVSNDGHFSLKLDYPFPYQEIFLSVGDLFYGALYANTDLSVELDMKKIKEVKEVNFNGPGVRYLGTDGALTTYMNDFILFKRKEQQEIITQKNNLLFSRKPLPADSLMYQYDLLSDGLKKIQDEFTAAHPSPYAWVLENERMSDYYRGLLPVFWNKQIDNALWEKMKMHKAYLVSNSGAGMYGYMGTYISALPGNRIPTTWHDVKNLTDLTKPERQALDSIELIEKPPSATPENMKRLMAVIQGRIQKIAIEKTVVRSVHLIDSIFSPAKADFMKMQLNLSKDLVEQKLVLDKILKSMRTEWCRAVIRSEFSQTVSRINEVNKTLAQSSGKMAVGALPGRAVMQTPFGASMYKISGMPLATFLTKLKQELPGKAIVLDRWATWCAPCLGDMPYSKQLHEDTKGMPVVFVYLCTVSGSSESKWKTKVAELKQPGIHYFIDEALDTELGNFFSFSGYPGYAFIDKTGTYQPNAITRISNIDKQKLSDLLK